MIALRRESYGPMLALGALVSLSACPASRTLELRDAGADSDPRLADRTETDVVADARDIPYLDPGCDAGEVADAGELFMCVPGDPSGCAPGEACYPILYYPEGSCSQERAGTICLSAGVLEQDAPCTTAQDCAPGYTCFTTASTSRCLLLCDRRAADPHCPRGRVCSPTDHPTYGACF